MARTSSVFELDPSGQHKLALLHAAATELWIGPESDDPLVQVAFHAVLEWLRGEVVVSPRELLAIFGRPYGSLGWQLLFVGSLLHDPQTPWPQEPLRLWWWVVKAALRHVSPKHERRQRPQSHVVGPLGTAS